MQSGSSLYLREYKIKHSQYFLFYTIGKKQTIKLGKQIIFSTIWINLFLYFVTIQKNY